MPAMGSQMGHFPRQEEIPANLTCSGFHIFRIPLEKQRLSGYDILKLLDFLLAGL